MDNIKNGVIPKSTKLLGSRAMANALGVNRQTVVAAYDELLAQGWIETKASKGTFVSSKIPVFKPISLDKQLIQKDLSIHIAEGKTTTGFHFNKKDHLTPDGQPNDSPFLTIWGFSKQLKGPRRGQLIF